MYFKIINNPRTNTPRVLLHIVDLEYKSEKNPGAVGVQIKAYGMFIDRNEEEMLTQTVAFENIIKARVFIMDYSFEDAEKWCVESALTR